MFKLRVAQDEKGARDSIARLESLAAEYPDVPNIVIEFAMGLLNLSDEQVMCDSIARLKSLVVEHPDVFERFFK
ncbi:MAG: hypothetical protein K2J04_03045 [Lachnospiraceae bacterium]|nr:hypothetical protein [Lachnospiraceae bacterium]